MYIKLQRRRAIDLKEWDNNMDCISLIIMPCRSFYFLIINGPSLKVDVDSNSQVEKKTKQKSSTDLTERGDNCYCGSLVDILQ